MPVHNGPHLLFAFAPTLDTHDRFFNCYPSSLLHAIAPLVGTIDSERLEGSYCDRIYHPKVLTFQALELWRTMLLREQPTHVGVSSTYDSWHVALDLSRVVREIVPEAVIIHGGPHLDEVLEPFVLSRTPQLDPLNGENRGLIDFAVAGDGEHALLWLVMKTANSVDGTQAVKEAERHKEQIASLPGTGHIVFFSSGERRSLKFRNPMPLDSLPFVPRHLLPVEDMYDFDCFRDEDGARKPTVTMITHRGCRARCNFCSEGLPYQARSHGHILAEAEQLREAGVRSIFLDDSTIQDDRQFLELLRGFHLLGLEVGALTRFDQIQDRGQLQRMRELGLSYFYASVEQYSDSSLDLMNKKLRTEQIDTGVQNCQEAGIRLGVSLLFGLPYETPDSVNSTLGYAEQMRNKDLVDYISMSLFSYHPKTPLGQMNRGRLRDFDFNHAPPNLRYPYTGFEEGSWYHPEHVTDAYADRIVTEAKARFGDRLVRELAKHRGDGPSAAKG
jgi:radical SAM superfamily enzyme YgiQ (UPF0313 family)